jgi:5-methylcytosine-specific restriction endonuclease McrA
MKEKQRKRILIKNTVHQRDKWSCRCCGVYYRNLPNQSDDLDAHHITDRNEMPAGGYVKENLITLCPTCHVEAEQYHISGGKSWVAGKHPDDLYKLIGSSKEIATQASLNV